jgi:hypothetical protein
MAEPISSVEAPAPARAAPSSSSESLSGVSAEAPVTEGKSPSLEERVSELESIVRVLREELTRTKKRVRQLEGEQQLSVGKVLTQVLDDDFEDEKAKEAGYRYLQKNMTEVVDAKEFLLLPKDKLKSLYERKHFLSTEDDLFKGLLKWARNQTQNEEEQKKLIVQFTDYIRFENMSSQSFSAQVLPLALLPMEKAIQIVTSSLAREKKGVLAFPPITTAHDMNKVTVQGQLLKFTGASHIRLHSAPAVGDNFTIMVRVRPTVVDGAFHGFLGKQGSSRSPSMWVAPGGGFHWDSYSLSGQRFGDIIDSFFVANEWTHVIWVHRGEEYIFYRNGKEVRRVKAPQKCLITSADYDIGRVDNNFIGELTDIRIYSEALDPQQIEHSMGYRSGALGALLE